MMKAPTLRLGRWSKILRTAGACSLLAAAISIAPSRSFAQADCDENGITDFEELFGLVPIYSEDFSGDTSDLTLSGLWRISADDDCFVGVDGGSSSGLPAAFYNIVQDGFCDFDTGETTLGRLETPTIQLPVFLSDLELSWDSTSEGENGDPYDAHRIYVRDVETGFETLVYEDAGDFEWTSTTIGIFEFQGRNIQLVFEFDSVDGEANGGFGWIIDDITLTPYAGDCDESGVPDSCEYVAVDRFPAANLILSSGESARTITLSFTSAVSGVGLDDFVFVPIGGDLTGEIVSLGTADNINFEIEVGNIVGDGAFRIDFIDDGSISSPTFQPGDLVTATECSQEDASRSGPTFFRVQCAEDIDQLYTAVLSDNGTRVTDLLGEFAYFFSGGSAFDDDMCGEGGGEGKNALFANPTASSKPTTGPTYRDGDLFIDDGGDDMYDCGNGLATNRTEGSPIPYTFGEILDGSFYFGEGSLYTTFKVPGMFVMNAQGIDIDGFGIVGETGADGDGELNAFSVELETECGNTYSVFIKQTFDSGDPSINQFIIIPGTSEGLDQIVADDTDDDLHVVDGLAGRDRLWYFLVAGFDEGEQGGGEKSGARDLRFQYDEEELIELAEAFITYIDCCEDGEPLTITAVPQNDANPTQGPDVHWTVNFSRPVTGFDSTDVDVTGLGPNLSITSITVIGNDGDSSYVVELGGVAGEGFLGIDILNDGSIVADDNADPLAAGFDQAADYLFDNVAPRITGCEPEDFTTPCNSPEGFEYFFYPSIDDFTSVTLQMEPSGPYPLGETTDVTSMATDAVGNTSTWEFAITVTEALQEPIRTYSNAQIDGYITAGFVPGGATPPNPPPPVIVTAGDHTRVGDSTTNQQTMSIFSFDTTGIPVDATITSVRMSVLRTGNYGNTASLGELVLDMSAAIGAAEVIEPTDTDLEAAAVLDVADVTFPIGNTYRLWADVRSENFEFVNREGVTQFRLRFTNPTNGNGLQEYLALRSGGSSNLRERPTLIIEYSREDCGNWPVLESPAEAEPVDLILYSQGAQDGGVTEVQTSAEIGGPWNGNAGSTTLGDSAAGQQNTTVFHFDTSSIPPGSRILSAELRVYCTSKVGDPTTLGNIYVDMRNPYLFEDSWYFGTSEFTEPEDFESFAHLAPVGTMPHPARRNTYVSACLNPVALAGINPFTPTQLRLRCEIPSNGNSLTDAYQFATGNYGINSPGRPALVVRYIPGDGQGGCPCRPDGSPIFLPDGSMNEEVESIVIVPSAEK